MTPLLLIVGDGMLAGFVQRELSKQYEVIRHPNFDAAIPEPIQMALVLNDGWNPNMYKKAEESLRKTGIPWLRAFIAFGVGMIGPLSQKDIPGCSQCVDLRRLMAGRDRQEMREMQEKLQDNGGTRIDAAASRTGLFQMARLVSAEIKLAIEGKQSNADKQILLMNMKSLNTSRHSFLPDPLCTICGKLPKDSPTAAKITLQPSPKVSPNSYRSRSIDDLSNFLAKDYLDQQIGFLNNKMIDLVPPFADVSVNLPLLIGDEGAAGRTNSYAVSELTAILEALERYCGIEPRGKRTVIYDSYNNLKEQALNPLELGVHAKENYEQPHFPFRTFDSDRPINWVWGYSFLQERPILVPELLAYYSLGCGEGFVYETSNGCALGGSFEEAIMYGILEVVERDSFLLTWYAQLSLPRLDPYSSNDDELHLMIDRARVVGGYDIYLYNATMENQIPSVFALAKNRKQSGMNIICAGGAHPDPIRATKSAVHELAGMMLTLDEKFEKGKEEYKKMLKDSSLVKKMEDHGMLFGLQETEERLQFLLNENRPLRSFHEEFVSKEKHFDLTDDLRDILQAFRRLNLDVIVVDQTTPEIKKNGLHCVKVLIPGMLPMTFGHHLTRVTGLERVLKVPMELGYTKQPLTIEQLNPYPHPFP